MTNSRLELYRSLSDCLFDGGSRFNKAAIDRMAGIAPCLLPSPSVVYGIEVIGDLQSIVTRFDHRSRLVRSIAAFGDGVHSYLLGLQTEFRILEESTRLIETQLCLLGDDIASLRGNPARNIWIDDDG